MKGEGYFIIGTDGIGFWPNACLLKDATRYRTEDEARAALNTASLTEWSRKESLIIEVATSFRYIRARTAA